LLQRFATVDEIADPSPSSVLKTPLLLTVQHSESMAASFALSSKSL